MEAQAQAVFLETPVDRADCGRHEAVDIISRWRIANHRRLSTPISVLCVMGFSTEDHRCTDRICLSGSLICAVKANHNASLPHS